MITQLLILCLLFAGVGVIYLQSLARASFFTGWTSGFHQQGISFVHYGGARYSGDRQYLDYLVFELAQRTTPGLEITANPDTSLFGQNAAYRIRTPQGRYFSLPIQIDTPGGEVFVVDPEGQVQPAGFSVTREEWNRYFRRYRQIGDGNLSPENLRAFVQP
jgi:hypothetical protein